MQTPRETILSTLPGSSDNERVLMVLCAANGESCVELRQQSWGEGLGWFTQSSVTLEPEQVADLRAALGNSSVQQQRKRPVANSHEACYRIFRAESA